MVDHWRHLPVGGVVLANGRRMRSGRDDRRANDVALYTLNVDVTAVRDLEVRPSTFWSHFLARLSAAVDYICADAGVDSSGCFPFRARTHRQTERQTPSTSLPSVSD